MLAQSCTVRALNPGEPAPSPRDAPSYDAPRPLGGPRPRAQTCGRAGKSRGPRGEALLAGGEETDGNKGTVEPRDVQQSLCGTHSLNRLPRGNHMQLVLFLCFVLFFQF